jgi:hypothetical protein
VYPLWAFVACSSVNLIIIPPKFVKSKYKWEQGAQFFEICRRHLKILGVGRVIKENSTLRIHEH